MWGECILRALFIPVPVEEVSGTQINSDAGSISSGSVQSSRRRTNSNGSASSGLSAESLASKSTASSSANSRKVGGDVSASKVRNICFACLPSNTDHDVSSVFVQLTQNSVKQTADSAIVSTNKIAKHPSGQRVIQPEVATENEGTPVGSS